MTGKNLVPISGTALPSLDDARQAIGEARRNQDAESLSKWHDQAEAVQRYQARRGASRETADDAGEIRLRCEAALGQIDAEVAPRGHPEKDSAAGTYNPAPLSDVRRETRAAWRKLGGLSDDQMDSLTARLRADEDAGLTTTHAVSALKAEALGVHTSSAMPDWGTPQDLFDVLDAEFGFELDVCATPALAKCERYFSPEDDGLTQDWTGICWMNPPYGTEIAAWIEKARESAKAGATVVCLVPARVDTGWWWDYARRGEVRFLRGRLRFEGAEAGAPFPSAVIVFGHRAKTVYWDWR